jgi:hypothetical protein
MDYRERRRPVIRGLALVWTALVLLIEPAAALNRTIEIAGPAGSGTFGIFVNVLPNGNIVVVDPFKSGDNHFVGAVYLYTPSGSLISTLTGSSNNDLVGLGRVTVLANGNFVVSSPSWNNGSVAGVGAVTWIDGNKGLSGTVSATNSLVGSLPGDAIGLGGGFATGTDGVVALRNGNYVVSSPAWRFNEEFELTVGASTWADGNTGITGVVSASNSLVGSTSGDTVGPRVVELANGNYVVISSFWNNGTEKFAGAVTWVDGATGATGPISPANSIVGTSSNDQIGVSGVVALTNGNYVIESPTWSHGSGAITWVDGSKRAAVAISAANSLTGAFSGDQGTMSVTPLSNGNYVACDSYWANGKGSATWGNGATGLVGVVSATNSLVGSRAGDFVGLYCATALGNGNYVVSSPNWSSGSAVGLGAATWGDGNTGISGVVDSSNSLIGTTEQDLLGRGGIIALRNGNYVVSTPGWSSPTSLHVGAATWVNGMTGLAGDVTAENSLVGTTPGDSIGSGGPDMFNLGGVTALSNGNYVISSPTWHNGTTADAGAVTWGNGNGGSTGVVSGANSIVGLNSGDFIGEKVTALANGNYVIPSPNWSNGALAQLGAATWVDGSSAAHGVVSPSNSLIGSNAADQVARGMDAPYQPWATRLGVNALSDGNYMVFSPLWQNTMEGPVGAMTFGHGNGGTIGPVTTSNSVIGRATNAGIKMAFAYDAARKQLVVGQPASNGFSIFKGTGVGDTVNPNQHGFTGSWYNPGTAGQGIEIEVYPDLAGFGKGVLFGGWFTFDVTTSGGQRWYAMQGTASSNSSTVDLDIATGYGGNLNAPPAVTGSVVGHASLQFTDCNSGTLTYTFADGSNRTGSMPLLRLIPNVTCSSTGDNGNVPGDYLLSGSWYDAATSGQGLIFDVNPIKPYLFAAWYTYAINGQQVGGPTSQRWYTLQSGEYANGATSLSGIGIYTATGGVFDNPAATTTGQVGTADIVFASCNALTLTYVFTNPENLGRTGTIHLTRTGPAPSGCAL